MLEAKTWTQVTSANLDDWKQRFGHGKWPEKDMLLTHSILWMVQEIADDSVGSSLRICDSEVLKGYAKFENDGVRMQIEHMQLGVPAAESS